MLDRPGLLSGVEPGGGTVNLVLTVSRPDKFRLVILGSSVRCMHVHSVAVGVRITQGSPIVPGSIDGVEKMASGNGYETCRVNSYGSAGAAFDAPTDTSLAGPRGIVRTDTAEFDRRTER